MSAERPPRPVLSVVIVAHNSLAHLRRALPPLLEQLRPADEVIIVDSGSADGLSTEVQLLAPGARLLPASGNVGFAAGANLGVAHAAGDMVVLLNPDVRVNPGWRAAITAPWEGEWAAWMGLVTMDGGETINTSGGVVHFTGLGWAGQAGEPVGAAPSMPTEVGFLSGACLAIPLTRWRTVGGFAEHFFMYCEDVDLSLRLRLSGGRIGIIPAAVVLHDYDFDKGPAKWRLLERNRWATIIRTYPTPVLALVLPGLIATELAIWVSAARGGWASMKALATLDTIRAFRRLLRERASIQATRKVAGAEFAAGLTSDLSSVYLDTTVSPWLVRTLVSRYWDLICLLLRVPPLSPWLARDTTPP